MHSNKIWKTWAMVHTEFWGKKQGLFIFSRTCLFDIEWHLPFTPAVLFVFFVSGVRFQRALLTSHTIYTKFFSCQPWMKSPRLCIEGQITIYYCTDNCPFCPFDCVATIIPIQNNIENIHTSVPRKGFQTFQIHRWRGCSLIAIPPSRKQEGLVTRVLQIIKKWTITWILKINLLEKNHHCHAYT